MKTMFAQVGHLGTTKYYLAKMTAGELIDSVGLAIELPEWDGMTADEKMQREPDLNRVVNEICPYFTEDKDRFFGAIIVDIYSGYDDIIFDSLADKKLDLSAADKYLLKDTGFLTLPGSERLIALDGQHRTLAMKLSIKGKSAITVSLLKDKKMTPEMEALEPHPELAKEEISVIFVQHTETEKIRKIFNKVNRYARQTGRGQNIITSDDDVFAVFARKLFSDGGILANRNGIGIVNWKSNTLSKRSKQLTTVSSLYTIGEILLADYNWSSRVMPSNQDTLNEAYGEIEEFWRGLLDGIDVYKMYLQLTEEDRPVGDLREENLLMKPVTHMALAHVAYLAKKKKVAWTEVVKRLNKVDWARNNKMWVNILVLGNANNKMITGKDNIRSAGMLLAYMVLGKKMKPEEVNQVKEILQKAVGEGEKWELPKIIE